MGKKPVTVPLLQEERHQHILKQIGLHQKVRVEELTRTLHVSADTVRRDLIELEEEGKLLRVHGGAISTDFNGPFQPREVYAQKEKMQIARKALTLIRDGMTLLTGGGTVMLELARLLPENLTGTFFTVSPLVALEVAQRSSVEVILLSGKVSRPSYICTGAQVVSQLADLRADLCLMGANGFSLKEGITDYDWDVAQVKKAMLQASEKTALLCLSEKKDVVRRYTVSPFRAIEYLITERPATDKQWSRFSRLVRIL